MKDDEKPSLAGPRIIRGESCDFVDAGPGQLIVRLRSFSHFGAYVRSLPADLRSQFIWRGQAQGDWKLESSFDRLRRDAGLIAHEGLLAEHLARFKRAARGRIAGLPQPDTEDEWWAYAQHHGLKTPLLDWTTSPFTAAFFALAASAPATNAWRCVYGLHRPRIDSLSGRESQQAVKFVDPFVHSSPRLLAQDGVFTKAPSGITIEEFIRDSTELSDRNVYLVRIEIPENERGPALSYLKEMRLSYQSLFPDIEGAALDCNLSYELQGDITPFEQQEEIGLLKGVATSEFSIESSSSNALTLRGTLRRSNPKVGPGSPSQLTHTVRDETGQPVAGVPSQFTVHYARLVNPFAPYKSVAHTG